MIRLVGDVLVGAVALAFLGLSMRSAIILALGLSLLAIAIASFALWLVLPVHRENKRKGRDQDDALGAIDTRAARIEANFDEVT